MFIGDLLLFVPCVHASFSLYPDGLNVAEKEAVNTTIPISNACLSALKVSIDCDNYILSLAAADWYGTLNSSYLQNTLCSANCAKSLRNYRDSVISACGHDPDPWEGVPANWAGDVAWAAYNRTCLQDSDTGQYCSNYFATISSSLTEDTNIVNLPKDQLCSNCMIALAAQTQSTPYSNYNKAMVEDWKTIQTICNVTFPTEVQQNPIVLTQHGTADSSSDPPICLSGILYNVTQGDSCSSIAEFKNVAMGTLQIINNIFPDCSNLKVGMALCLPPPCQTHLVQAGETCWSIASANGIPFSTLLGYNPTVNRACTNLILGSNICVSPPAGLYTPELIPNATATQAGAYATATAVALGPLANDTTPFCGRYYKPLPGEKCAQISMKFSINATLFRSINPSVDSDCTNLNPDVYYCVWPLRSWKWSSTASAGISVPTVLPGNPPPPLQAKDGLGGLIWAGINW